MKFSICVPTRGRVNNIIRLLRSIEETSFNTNNVQLIFRIDEDDTRSEIIIKAMLSNVDIDLVKGKRGDLSDMWEDCYPKAKHDGLMMCADDVIFRTDHWDRTMSAKLPENDIWFAWGNDMIHGRGLATLPFVSRKWVETVGYFVPRGYTKDYCDTHIHNIARRVRMKGHNIQHYFDDLVFEHMHPGAGKAKMDDTYKYRLNKPSTEGLYNQRAKEREEAADKIINAIKK